MSFSYSCERCSNLVTLTQTEFDKREGMVLCPDCLGEAPKITSARKLKQFRNDRLKRETLKCSCGAKSNVRKHYKLDANLRETYELMCTACARRRGWTPVDYSRAPIMAKRGEAA